MGFVRPVVGFPSPLQGSAPKDSDPGLRPFALAYRLALGFTRVGPLGLTRVGALGVKLGGLWALRVLLILTLYVLVIGHFGAGGKLLRGPGQIDLF